MDTGCTHHRGTLYMSYKTTQTYDAVEVCPNLYTPKRRCGVALIFDDEELAPQNPFLGSATVFLSDTALLLEPANAHVPRYAPLC